MFSDVAQEIEVAPLRRPIGVVHEPGRILFRFEIKQARELWTDRFDIRLNLILREELALGGFAAGIADASGRSASDRDRKMPGILKSAQRNERHEMSHVQTVRRRIKAAVKRER